MTNQTPDLGGLIVLLEECMACPKKVAHIERLVTTGLRITLARVEPSVAANLKTRGVIICTDFDELVELARRAGGRGHPVKVYLQPLLLGMAKSGARGFFEHRFGELLPKAEVWALAGP